MSHFVRAGAAFVFVLAGCASSRGSLFGSVTYQGKPVVYGTVTAIGGDGITRSANIEADGTYRLENLPLGEVRLAVVSPEPPNARANERRGERPGAPKGVAGPVVDRAKWFEIPAKYGDPRSSGLSAVVTGSANPFPIELH